MTPQERTELQRLAERYEARHKKWYSSPAGPAYGKGVALRYNMTIPNGIDTGYNQLVNAFMEADADVSALLSLAAESEELRVRAEGFKSLASKIAADREVAEREREELRAENERLGDLVTKWHVQQGTDE